MAPMDKYTRLVWGAVHGLSCFHIVFPLYPAQEQKNTHSTAMSVRYSHSTSRLVKLMGTEGDDVKGFSSQKCVAIVCFGTICELSVIIWKVWVTCESVSPQSDASPNRHHVKVLKVGEDTRIEKLAYFIPHPRFDTRYGQWLSHDTEMLYFFRDFARIWPYSCKFRPHNPNL